MDKVFIKHSITGLLICIILEQSSELELRNMATKS